MTSEKKRLKLHIVFVFFNVKFFNLCNIDITSYVETDKDHVLNLLLSKSEYYSSFAFLDHPNAFDYCVFGITIYKFILHI